MLITHSVKQFKVHSLLDVCTHALQMGLQFVLGIVGLVDPGTERVVNVVVLSPHGVGAEPHQGVDFSAKFLRCLSFLLRSPNVVMREFHPRMGHCDSAQKQTNPHSSQTAKEKWFKLTFQRLLKSLVNLKRDTCQLKCTTNCRSNTFNSSPHTIWHPQEGFSVSFIFACVWIRTDLLRKQRMHFNNENSADGYVLANSSFSLWKIYWVARGNWTNGKICWGEEQVWLFSNFFVNLNNTVKRIMFSPPWPLHEDMEMKGFRSVKMMRWESIWSRIHLVTRGERQRPQTATQRIIFSSLAPYRE